jgi:hypothetical protein
VRDVHEPTLQVEGPSLQIRPIWIWCDVDSDWSNCAWNDGHSPIGAHKIAFSGWRFLIRFNENETRFLMQLIGYLYQELALVQNADDISAPVPHLIGKEPNLTKKALLYCFRVICFD